MDIKLTKMNARILKRQKNAAMKQNHANNSIETMKRKKSRDENALRSHRSH